MKKILILSILFSFSCSDTISIEKDEAKQRAAEGDGEGDGEDYCETFNWYDDGQCDLFCINPDPDCAVATCGAVPVCSDGTHEVSACGLDASCIQVELCGTTITCEESSECEIEPVSCPEGQTFESTCPPDDIPCDSYHDNCGNYYACVGPQVDPCPEGTLEVDKCLLGDTRCVVVVSDNDERVACIPNQVCQVPVYCNPDEILFRSKEDCLATGNKCRQTYRCADIGWCAPDEGCKKKSCSADEADVSVCTDVERCRDISGCGEDLFCLSEPG